MYKLHMVLLPHPSPFWFHSPTCLTHIEAALEFFIDLNSDT
jgi:hypothetical protein